MHRGKNKDYFEQCKHRAQKYKFIPENSLKCSNITMWLMQRPKYFHFHKCFYSVRLPPLCFFQSSLRARKLLGSPAQSFSLYSPCSKGCNTSHLMKKIQINKSLIVKLYWRESGISTVFLWLILNTYKSDRGSVQSTVFFGLSSKIFCTLS